MRVGGDGYIESSISGPDVVLNYQNNPSRIIKEAYDQVSASTPKLYNVLTPSCYQNIKTNPFRKLTSLKVSNKKTIQRDQLETLYVKEKQCALHPPGFAFPYPCGNVMNPSQLTFAFLNHNNASKLIKKKRIKTSHYIRLLDHLSMYKKTVSVYHINEKGLCIEEVSAGDYNLITRKRKMTISSNTSPSWIRKGFMHGIWVQCDTIDIPNPGLFKLLIQKTYGNFGFQRTKSPCFGLNTYTGKKAASYVRATPKMSKESTTLSEYYRDSFDPTFLPVIYKLMNKLSDQAQTFQAAVDPVYDSFLSACFSRNDLSILIRPKIFQDLHQDSFSKRGIDSSSRKYKDSRDESIRIYSPDLTIDKPKKYFRHRRFAGLSIMTNGNTKTIGFSNTGHTDNDFIDRHTLESSIEVLNEFKDEIHGSTNKHGHHAFQHLQGRFLKKNNFSTYTTCGYKVLLNGDMRNHNNHLRAFFLYNSLGIAIGIPHKQSCYHTFDATSCMHQTTIPIIEDEQSIIFQNGDISIFAWGNGKCAKRLFLEEHQVQPRSSKFSRQEILNFFNSSSDAIKNHMLNMNWV